MPYHGDLSKWAYQGVFLINACLTVRPNKANSHGETWAPLIIETLNRICKFCPKVVFLLWGGEAQKMIQHLGDVKILTAAHPSGLSTYGRNGKGGFFGCNHFQLTNEHLIANGIKPIDWQIE